MNPNDSTHRKVTIIEPSSGLSLPNFKEFFEYRDLLLLLLYRDIRSRFAQSVLGFGWAFIQPLFRIVIFSVIFGQMVKIDSEGVPYTIYSAIAVIPWTFFTNGVTAAGTSLKTFSNMLTKVYFPRLIIPISVLLTRFVDFTISFVIVVALMFWYNIYPGSNIIYLPLLIILTVSTALGLGLWLTSLGVKYRDINYSLSFFIQLGLYVSPVIYGLNQIPEKYRLLYAINPMVGVIEGFRSSFLSTNPMPWAEIGVGSVTVVVLLITGLYKFRQTEKIFADVV